MNMLIQVGLVVGIFVTLSLKSADGIGSKTYETNNGFPVTFLNDLVNSDIVQKKLISRWKWQVWDVVPGTHAYQLYVFNITNPDEVEKGGKPIVVQVGPYYYQEYRYKFDVSMNLDMSVNFERNFSYTFDPAHSKGSEDDIVNTINVPLIIFSVLASKHTKNVSEVNKAISSLLQEGESIIRKNVKIGDLLYHGVDVSNFIKYMDLMGPPTPLTEEFADDKFAILKLKNGANEGQFTVDSGLKVEKNVGQILNHRGRKSLPYWEGDECNKIRGSDGSVFPPHLKKTDKLEMLEVDLCRSVSFEYVKEVQFKNVMGSLYAMDKSVLGEPVGQVECFCEKDSGPCLKKGVLDVSTCQYGAPYVMSYAHFLNASKEYQEGVQGLQPDPKIHRTEVTLEPVTGAVITFHKRFQWNMWIKPIAGIDYFKKFPNMIVPLLWNDDVFNLDPDKEELLMEELARQGGGIGGAPKISLFSHAIFISFAIFIFGY